MTDEPRMPWEEDHGPEEQLLLAHGFHRVRGLDDVWQLGSVGASVPFEAKAYTREEALRIVRERQER